MKKLLLTLFFLFIIALGYSQNSDYAKNEISVGIFNLIQSPSSQELLFKNSFYFVPFSNLTYKRFINKRNAIRLVYQRPIDKSYDISGGDWISKGKYNEQVLKIGYEYIFEQKRLTPYVAIDFSYLKSSSSSETGGGFIGSYSGLDREIKGFGLSPIIGVNYKMYKNIFIGIESNLSIIKINEDKTSSTFEVYPAPQETIVFERNHYYEYIFNPIVFLVKVNF